MPPEDKKVIRNFLFKNDKIRSLPYLEKINAISGLMPELDRAEIVEFVDAELLKARQKNKGRPGQA